MQCLSIGRVARLFLASALAAVVSFSATLATAQDKEPAVPTLKPKAPAAETDPTAPIKVPDGKPEELLEFIEKVSAEEPPADAPEEVLKAFILTRLHAMAAAGSKVLAGKPNEEQALTATRARLSALVGLKNLEDKEAEKQIEGLPGELTAAGFPKIARAVSSVLLQQRLGAAASAAPEQRKAVVDEIVKFVGSGPIERSEVGLAMRTTMMLEQTGDDALAADAYAKFGEILQKSDDKMVAGFGRKMEGAARRLRLPGNPMEVEGTRLDGKKLDWSTFDKKAVLVMFWATWCGPCKAELPNVLALYKQYHDKGFDVVGISCDDDKSKLEEFVKEKELPWPILFSSDAEATGMDNPMADKYGVMGIPSMILVGPDGKVVSLAARGPQLAAELEKIYGPAEKPAAEKKAE